MKFVDCVLVFQIGVLCASMVAVEVDNVILPDDSVRSPVEVMFPVTDIALSKVPPSLLLTASADEKVSYARISTSSLRLSAVRPAIVFAVEVL